MNDVSFCTVETPSYAICGHYLQACRTDSLILKDVMVDLWINGSTYNMTRWINTPGYGCQIDYLQIMVVQSGEVGIY